MGLKFVEFGLLWGEVDDAFLVRFPLAFLVLLVSPVLLLIVSPVFSLVFAFSPSLVSRVIVAASCSGLEFEFVPFVVVLRDLLCLVEEFLGSEAVSESDDRDGA